MENFIFDLQRFSQVTIAAGDTYELDGVTYTAVSDAVLNLDDDGKVSGVASGSVSAVVTGRSNPTVTVDATNSSTEFTLTGNGSVLTLTKVLPFELDNGTFTLAGNVLTVAKGSDLRIGTGRTYADGTIVFGHDYADTDITYTINDTTLTEETEKGTIVFTASLGEQARSITTFVSGKIINGVADGKFTGGFTITKGSSMGLVLGNYTVKATANADATSQIFVDSKGINIIPGSGDGSLNVALSRNDTEIISGELNVTSGKITFGYDNSVTFDKDTSWDFTWNGYTMTATTTDEAQIGVSLTGNGISFTPGQNDGGLNLLLRKGGTALFGGELNVSGGTITFDVNMQKFSFTEGTEVSIKLAGDNPQEFQFKVTGDDASFKVEADGSGTFTITPDSGDGTLDITIKQGDKTIFYNNISVSSGSIVISDMGQTIGLTSGTSMTVTLGNYTIDITANDDASFGLGVLSYGSIAISPKDNDGSLDISISRGSTQIFSNTISISGGTITFNPTTQLMTLTSGTTINLEFGNYELTATAKGNAASSIALTDGGITITPNTGDGSLDLTLTGTSSGSLNANIEVLSGSFTLGDGGEITVAAGTELQIKFSDDYIINFKATDKAGNAISLGTDGITFKPGSDDSGLQLTVKRGDDTRSASLDVTGSVTYKLDGTISLTKGTVVKNVFDSGNILTITANTDASGSINFNPQTGLTIKPTTTDALTVSLTTGDIEVVNITSIDGSITYNGGVITASNGTKARIAYYFGWESDLYTTGGTSSIQFTDDRTIYTANAGATFTVNYLDGTTTEIQHGSYANVYGETIEDYVELVSEGTTLKSNDSEVVFTLEKAGDYNLNGIDVTTSEDNTKVLLSGDYDTVQFAADAGITVSATEDKGFRFGIGDDGTITITTTDSGDFGVSSGSITFGDGQATIAEGTTISLTTDERVVTFTANKDISVSSKIEEDIYYLTLDEATADVTIAQDGQTVLAGEMVIDGVFSYRPKTGTFGLTGANSSHGDGNNTSFQFTTEGPTGTYTFKAETNDTTVVFVPTFSDGKFEMNFPNEAKNAMKFTVSKDGQTVFENNVAINGTIGFDTANQELSLTKDTVLTLTQGENSIEITALGDAGGKLNIVDGGLRFAPNTGDGQLELNFVSSGRKANIDVTGAVIFGEGGKISLENGTEVTFTWDDGTELKLTSEGSTGSIGIDEKGIKITSEDEKLTIDLTTATGGQSHLSGIQGTIYYNAGRVSFDDNSTITATTTLGGEPILITLETIGGTGHLEFASNGIIYSADTGAMQITWKKDDVESTFTVNSGSVQIGHGLFQIAEGTDLATDLKDFVPALYFTTSEAGTYTINGQTITTSAANISMTATDDYMTFKTSDDAITYDDMTFAGNGNVSLSTAGVVLGAGVEATGFGVDKMFILAEAGNVTADARIFELTEEVPTGISVTGAEDGFIFSRTNTEESEARFDDPDPANVGKIFTEEFFLTNDDSYRIQTDLLGLQQIIGVSSPATIKGNATFDGEPERTVFDVVTETEGVFTVADKDYSISGDDSVAIKVGFEPDKSYVRGFDSLSGTVSGDFTAHEVSINGSASAVRPVEDALISIAADENGFEVSGLDNGAILWVGAKDTYVVNGTTINANAGDYIAGSGDNFAYLLAMNNNTVVTGTESDDYIGNHGTNVTINALGGNDTIMNYGASNVTINGDADNDIIFNVARLNGQSGAGETLESPDNVLINGGAGNDYIAAEGSNVTITGGAGNDSIEINGDNTSVDAGTGSNQIKVSGKNEVILLKGRTTVEGFNTGFGEGSDTIYIKSENDPAGVEFLEDGLTFGNDTASLTLSDVTTTAKVNLFHENRDMLNKGVFIAAGDWYKVEDSDLTVDSGEEVYFVGTAATPKAGVDFSGVTGDLNLTMDTAYIDSEEYVPGTTMWINGVYSLKGGAGNTTITGSKLDDTILAGSGNTTIDAGAGNNQIKLSDSGAAVVFNGQTTVEGFKTGFGDGTDTVYIPGGFPSVDFKDGGLTFYDDTKSLTFKEVTSTAQINTYDAANGTAAKQVYIAEDDWYKVTDGEAQYYVGATASKNHGIDFSGVTEDLNVTLNTPDEATDASMWINNVHSIRGGDGNTTITGSDESDTIISGTGKTTINAGDGDDYIINSGAENILRGLGGNDTISNDGDNASINGGAGSDSIANTGSNVSINAGDGDDLITNTGDNVLFKYYSTGGNDSIVGFNSTSTLSIADEYSSSVSGNDLIVTVGDSKITLVDAASLSSANIESTDLSPTEQLAETILKRTVLGYPAMAAIAFSPDAKFGDEPTNYAAKEDWSITSTDDLELHAVHYTPENSNDKWVVLVHGYGKNHKAMYLYATSYLENGYNVLMIDQRAAGESEGTWLTMGGAESKDVALWTQEIARRNSNAKITLHGVSMGSATAMLAASRSDATNVVALVEDCGYTSAMDVFYLLNGAYVGAPTEVIASMDGVTEEFTGHSISEAAPIDSISSAKMPTLFISGDADTVVPVSMLSELYDASGAEVKEKFIVKDAPHALAGLNDSVGYNNAVFRFVAEASGEGWDTTNITDNISLRGTKYNDTIANYGSNVTIQAQDGDDSISNFGDNVSIDAGKGDDLISLSGGSVLVQYAEGDGNDTITGFDSNATLSIGDNVYSTQLSGDDLIITIGESKLTLVDAANLSDLNIESTNEVVTLVEAILKRTALGYPLASGILLDPETLVGEEPTNYSTKEDWSITSADNLELYGVHYAPENFNDKWVVLVHGYGLKYESMYPFATFYLENGYNVLMIDQRAAGNSEGTWLTMGAAESQDVALWTQEIARRNSNAKITLHGVSMGSATAMLAASRSDAVNVTSLIEDCGYTSAMKLFYVLKDVLNEGLKEFGIEEISSEVVAAMDSVGHGMMGYYLHDAAPIDSISSAKMPTLFISGDDDGVVPVSMLSELYDASGAEVKEKFTVKGAGHAQAGLNDPIGYSNAVFRFIAEANGEGWETTNIADNISLRGTKYNDTITNYGNNVTINAVEGDDSITNTSEYSIIDGGEGNDTITNYSPTGILASNGVSINAGADDDTIINEHAYYVTLDGGEGDDKIIVRLGDHTTIDGGSGNDSIIGETMEGGTSTWAMGGYANINGGSGDDYINPIFSDSASILGGDGNDTIINEGDDATINGGAGDDIISLQGASLNNDVIKYEAGDGNDIIYGFNETTKLSITAGAEYSTVESGDDVIVNVGDNSITIAGGAGLPTINIINYEIPALNITNTTNNTLITGTENNDTIRNSGDDVSIKGAAGNDSITSSGTNSSVNGGAGSDTIRNSGASSSIFGAEGDDQLINTADEALVDGGYGNDAITNSGDSVTIRPGGGFDSISNSGDNVVINYTGGNDSIQGFNATSTLSLSSDDYEVVEGSRNIFVFSGESFAVLQGAFLTNDSININDTAYAVEGKVISLESGGDEVAISRSNVSIVGGTGDDIIILTSDAANNTIEYAGGNDTIYGFNETSKLTIAGEHSSIKIGDDVFVTVGNNIITLVDASSVMATDFEDGESILLTAKGAVTVGNRIFELTEKVKNGVTITGTANGFTSGITNKDGSIFVEEFIADGDDGYHVFIDGDGLETISGIDAGTEIKTNATEDGEYAESEAYIVTEGTGKYTLNDIKITTTKDNASILLYSDVLVFDAEAAEFDGKTFTGDGKVAVSVDAVIIGKDVSATGFENGESFILAQAGTTTINGRTFELTEDITDGITIEGADSGYTFSHVITEKEIIQNGVPSDYLGKVYSEEVHVAGDDSYILQADSFGLRKVSGISDGASINGGDTSVDGDYNDKYAAGGQNLYLDTDTEGTFTIGEKSYSISGDSNVEIKAMFLSEKSYAGGFASLEGTVSGNFDGDTFYVNGSKSPILISGDDSISVVGSSDGTKLFGVSGNATLASLGGVSEVHTDTEGEFWIAAKPVPFGVTVTGDDNVTFGFNDKGDLMTVDDLEGSIEFSKGTGGALSINGIGIHTRGIDFSSIGAYDNSLYIHDIERGTITAYELEKVWLQMSGETMTLNGNELTLTADSDGIWLRDKEIVGLDVGASLQVSEAGTYTANTTELEAKAGDVIVGLEGDDAYIYDADKPLITTKTPNADIISHFNPNNQTVVGASETTNQNITLNGGDLAIVEATSAPVNITAGDDTVVSQGENVAVNLTGGNTWLFPIGGKMTLEGYDASTGSGFGTTYTDIASAVADGTIDFNDGRLTLGAAKVDMGKNSELMNFFDRAGDLQKVGFASRGNSLDVSNETADLLLVAKKHSTITGGAGDDTISVAARSFVDAGAGSNLVSMSSDSGHSNIVLNGNTTVEGFNMGWGRGSDTVYINAGDDPSVDFKTGGLTFYDNTDSLTLSDMSDTAKVNLYYEGLNRTRRAVFIAKDDWYAVSNNDLMVSDGVGVNSGSGIYFVGTSATRNHGIDFSGVTRTLNISMNTDYNSTTAELWVNNIHSIVGGAGNTSITGSDKSDTISAGTGRNNIWSGAGNDLMFGNTDEAKQSSTFFHMTGDGRDTIENFDFMDSASDYKADVVKLGSAITGVSMNGDNVILQTNNNANDSITLTNAKGKTFNLNDDLIAKVGDSEVAFDGFTNCYAATSSNATLTVGAGMSKVEVWLGDTSLDKHGTMFYGNFRELNAAQADGSNILAGNELSNVITGGSGRNSLWGGAGSASDTLVGGTGHNDFFYGAGNGNDAIQGMNDGDNVILDGITLDQISRADIYSGSVLINFNDGSLLRVNGTADVTYQLADGSRFSANHSRREWTSK